MLPRLKLPYTDIIIMTKTVIVWSIMAAIGKNWLDRGAASPLDPVAAIS